MPGAPDQPPGDVTDSTQTQPEEDVPAWLQQVAYSCQITLV
jgi:hypothetical protein